MTSKGAVLWGSCLLVALAMPFPTGHRYYPVARALWDFLTGELGHGRRCYWVILGVGVLFAYTGIAWLLVRGVKTLLARL
jgi:hypothetical protein